MAPPGAGVTDFVGRERYLQVLEGELRRAHSGDPRLVLVEGPAGMGKSSLLRAFLARRPERILSASGAEHESRLAYGVVDQLFGEASALGLAVPAKVPPGDDAFTTGAGVLDLLGLLQDDGPVIVVVDDAHWMDTPSLEALTFALRRLRVDRVLSVLAARDEAGGGWEALARAASGEHGTRVRLGGLDVEEIRALGERHWERRLTHRAATRLRDHTGGSPIHLRALFDQLDPASLTAGAPALPAPRSFGLLVLGRVQGCSPEARRLVEAAAVFDEPPSLGTVAGLARLDDGAVAFEEAVAAGLLAHPDTGPVPGVAFAHPLVRSAVYADMGPARRSALHRGAADLVGMPTAIDHRIAGALVEDDALAGEVEAHARSELGDGQVSAAADHLVAAASLTTSVAARERLVLDAIEVLLRAGEVPEAAALAERATAFGDSPQRRCVLGNLALVAGRHAEAEDLLVGACDQAERAGDVERAALASALVCHLYSIQMRWEQCVAWARRSVSMAEVDLTYLAQSLLVVGPAMGGRPEEGLTLADRLGAGPAGTAGGIELVTGRGLVRMWVDDLVAAREDLAWVVEGARPGLASARGLIALGWLTECEYRMGAWDDSAVHGALAVSLAADTDQHWLTAFVRAQACWVAAARGHWDVAEDHVSSARAAASASGDAAGAGYAAIAEAHLAFCRGQPARVVEAVQPFLRRGEWQAVREPGVLPWRELHAGALIGLQRLEEAEAVLMELDQLAAAAHRRSTAARAARIRAELEAARGEPRPEPESGVAQALADMDGLPMPFERGLLEEAYGRRLRRRGKRREAVARLEAAGDAFARLGAAPFAERSAGELAACGAVRRDVLGPPDLTAQELAVARLVTSGLTNRQVAQELVVSVKTVEYHLGHLFAKLGVTSRTQLARRLASAPAGGPSTGSRVQD